MSSASTVPVRRLASRTLATVPPEATLREVAEELALDEIGVVVVQHGHDPIGVISERDLVTAIGSGGDTGSQAAELMTVDLVTAPEETPVVDVARLMIDAGVRHVLVCEGGDDDVPGRVTGIVSMRDVVGALLDDRT